MSIQSESRINHLGENSEGKQQILERYSVREIINQEKFKIIQQNINKFIDKQIQENQNENK